MVLDKGSRVELFCGEVRNFYFLPEESEKVFFIWPGEVYRVLTVRTSLWIGASTVPLKVVHFLIF